MEIRTAEHYLVQRVIELEAENEELRDTVDILRRTIELLRIALDLKGDADVQRD